MAGGSAGGTGPRDWVGGAPYPWPAIDTLPGGAAVAACYCLVSMQRDVTRGGKPYYKLQLADRHGTVEGRVWDPVPAAMELLVPGGFVGVRGRVELFNGARQLKVTEIEPVEVSAEDLELFLVRSPRGAAAMEQELAERIAAVTDEGLRTLLERLLDPATETGRQFVRAPAAKHNHHAYIGGLLEHTLSITQLCLLMADHYGAVVDRDLLVAGALLHDLGKIREIGTQAGFPYTDEGKLLGHILLGLQLVADAGREIGELPEGRLLLLQHLIASHQGRYEWQSPREPRILEALILHYCDDLDAKMNQAMTLVAGVAAGWTPHDRAFGRDFLRHRAGAEGPAPTGRSGRAAAPRRKVKFAGKLAHPEANATRERSGRTRTRGLEAPEPPGSAEAASAAAGQASAAEAGLDPDSLDLFE